jgi:hypothetical protein
LLLILNVFLEMNMNVLFKINIKRIMTFMMLLFSIWNFYGCRVGLSWNARWRSSIRSSVTSMPFFYWGLDVALLQVRKFLASLAWGFQSSGNDRDLLLLRRIWEHEKKVCYWYTKW